MAAKAHVSPIRRPSRSEFPNVSDVTRKVMQANRSRDTGPEMVVRRLLHGLGFRYRLHRNDLPGRPDIVFPRKHKAVLVHGCFWHHHDCQGGRIPKTRQAFWDAKLHGNRARDERNVAALVERGWSALTVWECQLTDRAALTTRLISFLASDE